MIRTLREDINEVVVRHLSNALLTNQKINVPDYVSDFMGSLAEMILQQPDIERAKLVEHAHKQLNFFNHDKQGH